MTFDLEAARERQKERGKWLGDEELDAALDEIELLQQQVGALNDARGADTRVYKELNEKYKWRKQQRDAARELADKLAETLEQNWDTGIELFGAREVLRAYEAAKNPDGSWK